MTKIASTKITSCLQQQSDNIEDYLKSTKYINYDSPEVSNLAIQLGISSNNEIDSIIKAYEYGARTQLEFAEYLETDEAFLCWAIEYYRKKYGIMKVVDSTYIIYFEPFGIMHMLGK